MDLSRFPRRRYTQHPTPIEHLPHFSKALGGPQIWIKRDDQLGLTPGGNKTRKLEFLVADALAQGADTLVTCGAPQSNHCRITLSAAIKEGLKCRFVIEERVEGSYEVRDGVRYETLSVIHGKLREWAPPATAGPPAQRSTDRGNRKRFRPHHP